jgi:hypothetical protein
MSLKKNVTTRAKIIAEYITSGQPCYKPDEELIPLEDSKQDKEDALETLWSKLEDECKRIQDEIDRGCYSNPLDIIFEVHETISKCFEELLKEEKEAKP